MYAVQCLQMLPAFRRFIVIYSVLPGWMPCLAVDHSSRLPRTYQFTRKNVPTVSSRCEFWRFRSGVAEYSVLLGYEALSVGNRIRRSMTCRPVKISAVLSVETSGSYYPLTQRPVLKQSNLHFSSFHFILKFLWSLCRNPQCKSFWQ